MKNFKHFITEEVTLFHTVKEVPAKKSLLDVHMKLATADGGIYGKSKMGTTIPDRDLKHVQVTLGKQKYKGYGESFNSLEEAGLGKKTLETHLKHINNINEKLTLTNQPSMQVKKVHVLYDPHRVLIHLNNGKYDMGMTYHQGASAASGQRNFVAANGVKIPASSVDLVSLHTGNIDDNEILSRAKRLNISNRFDDTHTMANRLIHNGNDEVHRIIWNKFKDTHDKGYHAGYGIVLNLLRNSDNSKLTREIHTKFPHLANYI